MSELYGSSETGDIPDPPPDPPDTSLGREQLEEPAEADDSEYEETREDDDTSDDGAETLDAEEDGLPTRQEAREQTWGDDPEYDDENDLGSYYDGDSSTLTAEEDGLPARQEAWEQTWSDDPEHYDENEPAVGNDDTDELAAEEDGLPTRQEAWEQTWGDTAAEQPQDTRNAADDSGEDKSLAQEPHGAEHEAWAPAETADPEAERAPSELMTVHDQYGNDVPVTVVRATAEDRTVSDDKPWGIDQKPTGKELLDMDDESLSRFEMFRKETYEAMDNITDIAKEDGEKIGKLFERPPTGTKTEVPSTHPEVTATPFDGVDGGSAALAGIVAGVVLFEGTRVAKEKISQWKGRRHGGE